MSRRFAVLLVAVLLVAARPVRAEGPGGHAAPAPSLGGMTGLIHTPTPEVLADGQFRLAYSYVPKEQAYALRDRFDNQAGAISVGFLPRVEITFRATFFPGETLVEGQEFPNVDRMISGRVQILREGRWPALAVGIDDARGNRRFHALYAVAGKSLLVDEGRRGVVLSGGWASTELTARNHVLGGFFGGADLRVTPFLSGLVEYDTEKWNLGGRLTLLERFHLQVVALDAKDLAGGASWTHSF